MIVGIGPVEYTDREYLSMLDFIGEYGFNYSEATDEQLRLIALRAMLKGWRRG